MPKKKTWIWIIVGVLGLCVVAMLAVAGAGVYFVASHIDTKAATSADASAEFDKMRAQLNNQKPLFELDSRERPRLTRELATLPTASAKPEYLWILAFDPDRDGRLVRINLPFWLLRLGRRKIQVMDRGEFDLSRLNLDVADLERIGPQLLVDYRNTTGERVLVWTK